MPIIIIIALRLCGCKTTKGSEMTNFFAEGINNNFIISFLFWVFNHLMFLLSLIQYVISLEAENCDKNHKLCIAWNPNLPYCHPSWPNLVFKTWIFHLQNPPILFIFISQGCLANINLLQCLVLKFLTREARIIGKMFFGGFFLLWNMHVSVAKNLFFFILLTFVAFFDDYMGFNPYDYHFHFVNVILSTLWLCCDAHNSVCDSHLTVPL